ncbi:phage tail protein [Enterobacter roggenkampii]|uniref:phage tail protein n=1 Tax=Enterobacter roggenkampii TaxID=1812935 RepID=UPI001D08E370|nr:phage tail protein [Enterobacter roggenkampii]
MATKYYAVLTNVGAAKLANATALGAQVEITQMAVGDGNGALPTPNPAQTALVHELRRAPLNSLSIDPNNTNQIIAEQVIPEDVGGWWIREIGLFDKDGDMIAVANCAETYKPLLVEGSGRTQVIRMVLIVSSTEAVTLKIDPSVILATRKYVDDTVIVVKADAESMLAAHLKKNGSDFPDKAAFRKNLSLDRFVVNDSETEMRAPNGRRYLFITDKEWGCFDLDAKGAVPLTIGLGGTGATTPAGARKNLELGLAALLSKSDVSIFDLEGLITEAATTKQLVQLRDRVAGLANGGTGANNAADARKNLELGLAALLSKSDASVFDLVGAITEAATTKQLVQLRDRVAGLANGGTGANNAADARKNLELGLAALLSKSDASVFDLAGLITEAATTKQLVQLRDRVAGLVNGGTGANNAADARKNLELGTAAMKEVGTGAGQIPDMSAFPSGVNYTKLPNGKIFQWGSTVTQATGGKLVNFPVPFSSTASVSIEVTPKDVAKPNQTAAAIYSTTQFVIAAWDGSNVAVNTELYWYAIGS